MKDFSNIDEYASWTEITAVYPLYSWYPYWGLVEEAGEVAGTIAKYERQDYDVLELNRRLKKELGDVFWMLCRICEDRGWKPSEIIQLNYEKLSERMRANTIKGDGDDR